MQGVQSQKMTYKESVSKALVEILDANPKAILLGVGTGDGAKEVFGTTEAACKKYPERVWDTPVCEGTLTGMCIGLAIAGYYPILTHQRSDFALASFDQLINHAAIWESTYGQPVPFCVRMIVGRGWGNSSQHTKDLTPMLNLVRGLTVYRSIDTESAYSNLLRAHQTKGPVIVTEYRHLFDHEDKKADPLRSDVSWASASRPHEEAYYKQQADPSFKGPY